MSSAITIGSIGIIIFLVILFFVAIIGAIAIFFMVVYNSLVKARQKVRNAWSQIDVQLQRRFDLIPNLVESVKGYMAHEEGTLSKITELRTSWANAQTVDEKAKLEGELSGALKTIMAVSENYPDLKANQNFLSLQNDLKDTENKISYARQFYNDTVTMYNTSLEVFPKSFVAKMFKFTPEALFEVQSAEAKNNVKVDFNK